MDSEIIESVLSEILEEQKASLQTTKELATNIKELAGKVEELLQKADQQKAVVSPADTKVLQAILTNGIQQIQQRVEAQPKPIIRQFRFLLFPELYADQYYGIVLGGMLFWMMIFLLATYRCLWGKQGIGSLEMVREKNLEANHSKNAFYYLYQHADKDEKKKMIDAWQKSWQGN